MKIRNIVSLLLIYGFWVIVFMIQKPIFILFNPIDNLSFTDICQVVFYGAKLDLCTSTYLCVIPLVVMILRNVFCFNIKKILFIYHIIMLSLVSICFGVDTILYSYWGFRIDATLIFYLKDFAESFNSVTIKDVFRFIFVLIPYLFISLAIYYFTINKFLKKIFVSFTPNLSCKLINVAILLFVCFPLLVIGSRGGLSTATANVGMVYYCDNQKLNLSAVNPLFSLISSIAKQEDLSDKYIFFSNEDCEKIFSTLLPNNVDTIQNTSWLKTDKPNIVIVLLESFSANVIKSCNGNNAIINNQEVTPYLNSLENHSIVFTNAYSSGMRTDRGIVSVLSGFLPQPDMSIIKYPEKTRSLPSIAKSLSNRYHSTMIYGGDIDFANMRGYFYGSMYNKVIDYKSFDVKDRMSKWGVEDKKTFDFLFSYLQKETQPFLVTLLTLSSHEPFDVDFHKFEDKYVNSIAYTDWCIGQFVNKFKQKDLWDNTLIIFVADHGFPYPRGMSNNDPLLFRIPIIFTGGAVSHSMKVERFVNQTDIAKTLLSALKVNTEDFVYSRNVFSRQEQDFAFYVYTNGFCFMDSTGLTIFDNTSNKVIKDPNKIRENKGKAILQTLYRDIQKR